VISGFLAIVRIRDFTKPPRLGLLEPVAPSPNCVTAAVLAAAQIDRSNRRSLPAVIVGVRLLGP